MLVDSRSKTLKSYDYALVQFRNMWTKEVINIGVVLRDNSHAYIHLPKRFNKLKSCLDFKEIAGINYTIDVLRDRIQNQQGIPHGEVSNSVFITESKTFKSEYDANEALYEAADKFMMVQKLKVLDNDLSAIDQRHDKVAILGMIDQRAKEMRIKNFVHHKRFKIARKLIDMALVNKDDLPYSVASFVPLHSFDDHIINSIYTLQEVKRNELVKDQFLYVPEGRDMKKVDRENLGYAKEQSQHIGVDIITDRRFDAALERLQQHDAAPQPV